MSVVTIAEALTIWMFCAAYGSSSRSVAGGGGRAYLRIEHSPYWRRAPRPFGQVARRLAAIYCCVTGLILASTTERPSGSARTRNRPHVASWTGHTTRSPFAPARALALPQARTRVRSARKSRGRTRALNSSSVIHPSAPPEVAAASLSNACRSSGRSGTGGSALAGTVCRYRSRVGLAPGRLAVCQKSL